MLSPKKLFKKLKSSCSSWRKISSTRSSHSSAAVSSMAPAPDEPDSAGLVVLDDLTNGLDSSNSLDSSVNILWDLLNNFHCQPACSPADNSFVSIQSDDCFYTVVGLSPSPSTTSTTGSSAGFDPEKEKTVEFIVKVLNTALKSAIDSTVTDPAVEQCDSDAREEFDDPLDDSPIDSPIDYLNDLESIQSDRSLARPPSSPDDSSLTKIVSVLNAVKLRSLNNDRQAKKPSVAGSPELPDLNQPAQQPSQSEANVTDLTREFSQELNLNRIEKPASLQVPVQKPSAAGPYIPPALIGADPLLPPPSLPSVPEPDPEEAYRQANIKIEKGKCHYCKLASPECVLKCGQCPVSFCNYRGQGSFSHILLHLKASGHNEVDFKFDRAIGNPNSCNVCGSKNVFTLGFISTSRCNRYLLCASPCTRPVVEMKGLKEVITEKPIFASFEEYFTQLREKLKPLFINGERKLRADGTGAHYTFPAHSGFEVANIANWKPLISQRCLIEYVMRNPNKREAQLCKLVSVQEIESIEKQLEAVRVVKTKNLFSIETKDLIDEKPFATVVDIPVLLTYESGEEYRKVFSNLARMENGIDRLCKEDELGTRQVFNRTCGALKTFETNKRGINPVIYEILLGKRTIQSAVPDDPRLNVRDYEAPNLPALNHSQAQAIKHSLENPLTLIQGPPGTGKTTTSAAIVYHLSKLDKKRQQILVCAPSNIACDHLAMKIHETGLNVVRLLSKTKEKDQTYKPPLAAHFMLDRPPANSELARFAAQLKSQKTVTEYDTRRMSKLRNAYLSVILNSADAICVTCVSSADFRLKSRKFKYLLIDEVAQCSEPEVIIPLNRGAQKLVLIGDIQQLSPVIKNKDAIRMGYDQSLMLRLNALGNRSYMLNQQYRMHPQLSRFSREMFYGGLLKDGVTELDRVLSECTFKWPTSRPMFFYSCRDEEQTSVTGHSYVNRKEGMVIAKMVRKLVQSGVMAHQIGIITPYAGHREHLRTNLKFFSRDIDYEKIEIESINAYQGREKDIIILSTVRSNSMRGRASTGFLGDSRRLNVALTRARYGMIIVGDNQTLMNEPAWFKLLQFYQNNSLIFKGPIDNLEYAYCYLRKPETSDERGAKGNYYKSEVQENGTGEKTVQYQKVILSN